MPDPQGARRRLAVRPRPAALLDVLSVVVFVAAGRRTHADGVDLAGTASTAWPFLVALGLGWVVVRAWTAPARPWRTGVPLWLVTLVGGMLLRRLAGDGTAWPFVVVATLALGVLLVGWRLVALLAARRTRHGATSH